MQTLTNTYLIFDPNNIGSQKLKLFFCQPFQYNGNNNSNKNEFGQIFDYSFPSSQKSIT